MAEWIRNENYFPQTYIRRVKQTLADILVFCAVKKIEMKGNNSTGTCRGEFMRIVSLVENITKSEVKAKHGLSLYIETRVHKILFDLGPDNTLFENAVKKNIDISKIDTVIISHGHIDHGGALRKFLDVNSSAKIYVQKEAFEPHYSKTLLFKIPVGIDNKLKANNQIVLLDGDYTIDDELALFTVNRKDKFYSPMNNVLYDEKGKDAFKHEQNVIISENQRVLIMGCGHAGVVNIMEKAKRYQPRFCIGGFHLFNPITKKTVSQDLLCDIAVELQKYKDVEFYTCHCTGKKAFDFLAQHMNNIHYMSCGDAVEI